MVNYSGIQGGEQLKRHCRLWILAVTLIVLGNYRHPPRTFYFLFTAVVVMDERFLSKKFRDLKGWECCNAAAGGCCETTTGNKLRHFQCYVPVDPVSLSVEGAWHNEINGCP